MRAVICAGMAHQSIVACAAYHGVTVSMATYALRITGRLNGLAIAFGSVQPAPDCSAPTVVHGVPLLAPGYCVHRLGVYHGGRY